MPNSATELDDWARGQTDEQIERRLLEIGFMALMGGDLGGPLPPSIWRTYVDQHKALRRERSRRKGASA